MTLPAEFLYGVGAVVLLGALIWGFARNRGRNRANDPITDKATKDLYDHPDSYPAEKKELEKDVRPS